MNIREKKTVRLGFLFFFLNFKIHEKCVTEKEKRNKYFDYMFSRKSYDKTVPLVINVHPWA
jgi:hypothetical protein